MPAESRGPRLTALAAACCVVIGGAAAGASSVSTVIAEAAALEEAGRAPEAEAYLSLAVSPEAGGEREPALLMALARIASSPDEAVALAREVIETARDAELVAAAHMLRGDYLYARGAYGQAALEYEAAAQRAPADARRDAGLKRGESLLAAGDAALAEESLRSAAALNARGERGPWAEVGAARALMLGGQPDAAAEEFERIAEERTGHDARLPALAGAAAAREAAGAFPEAIAALNVIITEYPGSYEAVLARDRLRAIAAADTAGAAAPADSSAPSTP